MSSDADIKSTCETIRKTYSCCDVSDALLKLKVPYAGYLRDIVPLPTRLGSKNRIVAPVSTILFVDNTHQAGQQYPEILIPEQSNLPKGKHWTDVADDGSVVVMQQPYHQIAALVGDIVATRFKIRGIRGFFTDGRMRDVVGVEDLCKEGGFTAWAKGFSSVGTSIEAKPWSVDVPLKIGQTVVKPGDVMVADEGEMACCVIPRENLEEVMALLPVQKEADDGLLNDIQNKMDFKSAIVRWPKHYTHH